MLVPVLLPLTYSKLITWSSGRIVVTVAYLLCCRNRSFALLSSQEGLNNPDNCPVGQNLFTYAQKEPAQDFSVSDFMSKAALWLAISAVVSLAMGVLFLYVFKWHSRIMTRITIQVQVLLPAVMGISAIAAGQVGGGIILLLMSLLAAVVFYLW